jgi:hypothetical protein
MMFDDDDKTMMYDLAVVPKFEKILVMMILSLAAQDLKSQDTNQRR